MKLTLSDITSLTNETSATAAINANSTLIETALENTLSLDGTIPNHMSADLDLNGNRILNLPNALTDQEPITLGQLEDLIDTAALAPINASYLTLGTNSSLTSERVLTAGTGVSFTDGGAGSTLTINNTAVPASAALTRTSDTNVTLTLGGTPTTALLAATSLTLGWTGTLGASRGGFGADVSASDGVPLFATGVPTFTSTSGTGNFVRSTSPSIATPTLTGTIPITTRAVIGNATSVSIAGITPQLQVYDSATQAVAAVGAWSANANGPILRLYKSRNGTIGSHTIVQADDELGSIRWTGDDGANERSAAMVRGEVDGTPGANDMPGRLIFATTADGASSTTDRLILDSVGTLKPNANDGVSLGTSALAFADLFLAVGGVISMKSGTGQRAATVALVGGTKTVSNTTVTAATVIQLTRKTSGGTIGDLTYTLNAGVGFTINSVSGTDTSVVSYLLIEAP